MPIGNKKSLQSAHAHDSKRLFAKSTVADRQRIVFQSVAEQRVILEKDIGRLYGEEPAPGKIGVREESES